MVTPTNAVAHRVEFAENRGLDPSHSTMNEFAKLRGLARDKRDKMIAAATKEYAATLVQIASIEQDLLGTKPSRHKSLSSCIEHMIPGDRAFTILDIVTKLETLDPSRIWHKHSVDSHVAVLRRGGRVVCPHVLPVDLLLSLNHSLTAKIEPLIRHVRLLPIAPTSAV